MKTKKMCYETTFAIPQCMTVLLRKIVKLFSVSC